MKQSKSICILPLYEYMNKQLVVQSISKVST